MQTAESLRRQSGKTCLLSAIMALQRSSRSGLIQHGRTDRRVDFVILLFSNLVVCLVIYLLFTLRIRRGCLLFDNVKTVLYSGFFLIAAVYLSVVLEDVLDSSAESYPTAYLALNAFCILFAITILALEFSNCSIKSLEHENEMLAH